jgi:hypothetical protein
MGSSPTTQFASHQMAICAADWLARQENLAAFADPPDRWIKPSTDVSYRCAILAGCGKCWAVVIPRRGALHASPESKNTELRNQELGLSS